VCVCVCARARACVRALACLGRSLLQRANGEKGLIKSGAKSASLAAGLNDLLNSSAACHTAGTPAGHERTAEMGEQWHWLSAGGEGTKAERGAEIEAGEELSQVNLAANLEVGEREVDEGGGR